MNRIFLRALSIDDLPFTHKWHSDKALYQTLVGPFRDVSLEAEREWLQNKTKYSLQEVNLMICLRENNQPIGTISVREIDGISRKGHLTGIFIGETEQRNKGYGTEALHLMMRHCFYDLGLNRVWTYILEENQSSLKIFKKCGFKIEGLLRQHAFKEGVYKNVVVVGLCADQFLELDKSQAHQAN